MIDENITAMGALRLMPSKASEVATFSKKIVDAVKSGDANPLEVLVMLRALEAVSELVREEIEDNYVREAEKHAEKKFEAFGAIVEKCEVGTEYNFLICKDPTFERLEVDFEIAKAKLDQRKEFLKKITEPTPLGDTVTGELVTVHPPLKTSKSGVRVYLKHKS